MSTQRERARPRTFTAAEARTLLAVPFTPEARRDRTKATGRQAATLAKLGIVAAEELSLTAAGELLDALIDRIDRGLCSLRQVGWLVDRGVPAADAREVPFSDACEFIDEATRVR